MTLQELLKEERFQYLNILNEGADLSRVVMTVESTEAPDVAGYISPNTLLIMTGLAFQKDQTLLCDTLEELNERSCAGLAIKFGRFIDELDDCVLETANRLSFPLLQIPFTTTLGEVYHEVLSYIWNNQNDYLLNALNAQRKISNMILQGNSMQSIMNNLVAILKKPVMIVDLFGEIQGYGYTYMKKEREKTAEIIKQLLKNGEIESSSSYQIYETEEQKYCIYPIKGVGRNTNYMIILDFEPEKHEELLLVIEQILMAMSMYFYRNLYLEYNKMRSQEEFLMTLTEHLNDKIWTERQVLALGESYGIKQADSYEIVMISMEMPQNRKFNPNNFSRKEEIYILVYIWIKRIIEEGMDEKILIFPQESKWRYILLIQGKQENLIEEYIHIHDSVEEKFRLPITIAQGNNVSLLHIKNSYQEAERCIENGCRSKKLPYLLTSKPRNMLELFKFVPEKNMMETCTLTLKELTFPKDQMQEELRKTLQTYLACGSSITKTAESLFLHRNTIKYRIKKCEEILGIELSNVSDCFQIQLALVLTEGQ